MKDVVINRNKDGFLIIETVRPGGECEVQEGLGVLQIPSTIPVKAGMTIKIPKIDTLDTSSISEGFCIGPSVFYFSNNDDHEINHDSSLGSNLPFGLNRIARHVIYKDMNNKIHTRLFDGVPGSDICKGITPKEVAKIFEKMSVEWAYHLDGGQSAKIVTREQNISDMHKNIKSYGNKHYVQWPKKDSQPFLWDPDGGRKVPSGIKFQKKRDDQKQKEVLDLDTKYRVFD
jgi:hypothetical protein